jgi:hypothetical protein
MIEMKQPIERRGFLGTIAKGAAVVGLSSLALPLAAKESQPAVPDPSNDASFEAWLNKITGKHKILLDTPAVNSGFPMAWSRVFLMTNGDLGVAAADCSTVVVVRHDAFPLALESKLWEKYKFGEATKINDPKTKAPALRNIFWQPAAEDLPLPGMGIDQLMKDGVLFGVCKVALAFNAMRIAKEMKMDVEEVKKDFFGGILPGVQPLPSGVLAVNRTQEHGCTYCFAG